MKSPLLTPRKPIRRKLVRIPTLGKVVVVAMVLGGLLMVLGVLLGITETPPEPFRPLFGTGLCLYLLSMGLGSYWVLSRS